MLRLFIVFGGMMIFLVSNAYAVPSFSRQMGVSCTACHSQNSYPALNAFGRKYKASGFTLMGQQGLIESSETNDSEKGNLLSLPDTFNASFILKIRAQAGDESDSKLEFPDEAALILGGRVSKHIGSFIEIGYDSGEDKFTLANIKIPITYAFDEYTLGVVPYRTEGFGAAASFEVLNTGAVRGSRVLEDRKTISAQQYIGTAHEAEGLGVYLYTDLWHLVYSAYMPTIGTVTDYTPAHYFRAAMTPIVGTWDLGFGVQIWSGTSTYDKDDVSHKDKTDAYAVDFQAMGNVNDIPLSFFATYANAKNDADSVYNTEVNDKYATTFLTEVGVIPSLFNLSAGYRIADNGKAIDSSEDKAIIGAKYFIAENVQLQLNYTYDFDALPGNDENHVIFMLYGGF
jgi:hypothetical protein